MANLRHLKKSRAKLKDKLGRLGDRIDEVEGGFEEHRVADKYEKVERKLQKVERKIAEVAFAQQETENQAARYCWLRDNKHLDSWLSVDSLGDCSANIDEIIDNAIKELDIP